MSSNAAAASASKASASPAEATQRPRNKANSSLDRSSSMALAFFNRRHSSTLGLRRSVSSVSSRRHSSPISQNSEDGSETGGAGAKKIPRSLRWRLLANKVLGNVDEEDSSTHDSTTTSSSTLASTTNSSAQDKIPGTNGSSASAAKKKGFGGKWLPNIRKLSQGRGDKALSEATKVASSSSTSVGHSQRDSKGNFKLSKAPMGNKLSHAESDAVDRPPSGASASKSNKSKKAGEAALEAAIAASNAAAAAANVETIEETVAEVPPPMDPIKAPIPVSANAANDKLTGLTSLSSPGGVDLKPNESCDPLTTLEASSSVLDFAEAVSKPPVITADSVEKAIQERSYRLQELLDSERVYVCDLEHCCQYIQFMRESKEKEDHEIPMPEDLREGKDRMIFGNIEAIYEWHRDNFLKNLEACIDKPIELGNLFKKYDRKFQMYVVYCQNKPKSEYIVSEYIDTYFEEIRLKLGFKLRLTDLLIKPIQRLTKYHMLLEAMVKYSQRADLKEEAEALSKAFHVMTVVPNQANDMMDIGRLQGFEGKITAQGKLLHKGPLNALDNFSPAGQANAPPKIKPFTCFLFEQIMIFSETMGKKTQFTSPVYVYKYHFLVNKMALEEQAQDGDPLKFLIKSNDPARDQLHILCQADDEDSKKQWISIMKKQLQTQMDFLRALQAPIAYHNRQSGKDYAEPVLKSNPTRRYEGSKSNLMPQPQTLASSLPSSKEANAVTRAEVSPYRRWSETSVDQKVSNEWQSNFERSYIELEELGRGRFSVVRRCQEIMSGNEVAVKFVNRRKQNEPDTLREYRHLAQIKNPHLISSFGLYLTSNSYAIVMTLVPGGKPFLEKFCEKSTYSEKDVCVYMKQTMGALEYLHNEAKVVHLDLKPENLVLDSKANVVKLIDFGCAQSIQSLRPRSHCYESTEFLPPELLTPNSQKIGTHTDMWAFGVLLYVALSGLSPFLDDSQDETNNNILRGDFSFPDEYFAKLSGDAKDLIGRILCVNTSSRASSKQCLAMPWFSNNDMASSRSNSRIPTTHLTTFVRRRKKKLNSITLLGITSPSPTRTDMPDSSFQPTSSSQNSRILHHHKSPHY